MSITVIRGNDGFGSQVLSILSGIAYAKTNKLEYQHTGISGIKLVGFPVNSNEKMLSDCNNMLSHIMKNLNIKTVSGSCKVFPFFHNEILQGGVDNYYNDSYLLQMSESYVGVKPKIYNKNKFNIAIHIRRGDDILDADMSCRWIDNIIYENLIDRLLRVYPDGVIHIFSWNDPNLNINNDRVIYHITDDGMGFLDDFNSLVQSDLLVVGSSTFSISAGILNKNIVMCHDSLCKLVTPLPLRWMENYNKIIKL